MATPEQELAEFLGEPIGVRGALPRPQIQKLRYSHEAMVDMIIAEPWVSQNELAQRFQKTASWISTIIHSDAFQSRLQARADEIVDPALKLRLEENFRGLMARSMDIIRHKLDQHPDNVPDQLALRTFELTSRAAGYGARVEVKVENNVTTHIEHHGDRLVDLLRRKKAEVEEITDGEIVPRTD